MKRIMRFVSDDSGATAVEYGLIAAAMGGALIAVMPTLVGAITGKFDWLAEQISNGVTG